jgi:FAD/FMN-containing dehydrogenase
MQQTWSSWSGLVRGTPSWWVQPGSEEEIQQVVADTAMNNGRIAVVGSGHSFAPLVSADGRTLLSLNNHVGIESLRRDDLLVTVRAGTTVHDLNQLLLGAGLSLPNQSAIDEQTIAGALATASHGGSCRYGSLSEHLVGARVITADGSMRQVAEDDPEMGAIRAHLGCLGVVTAVTLRVVPAFSVRKVLVRRSLDQVLAELDWLQAQDFGGFYWFPHTSTVHLWWADRTSQPVSRMDAPVGWRPSKPLMRASMAPVPMARWVNRLLTTSGGPGSVRNLRSDLAIVGALAPRQQVLEYGVPSGRAAEALLDFTRLVTDQRLRIAAPVEVRFTGADRAWLSPAYQQQTCYVNVASYLGRRTDWATPFRKIARLFAEKYEGRSHWAKVHWHDGAELAVQYPRWHDFQQVRREWDPSGVFYSDYLRKLFEADATADSSIRAA